MCDSLNLRYNTKCVLKSQANEIMIEEYYLLWLLKHKKHNGFGKFLKSL